MPLLDAVSAAGAALAAAGIVAGTGVASIRAGSSATTGIAAALATTAKDSVRGSIRASKAAKTSAAMILAAAGSKISKLFRNPSAVAAGAGISSNGVSRTMMLAVVGVAVRNSKAKLSRAGLSKVRRTLLRNDRSASLVG